MRKSKSLFIILVITLSSFFSVGLKAEILQDSTNFFLNQKIFELIKKVDSISRIDSIKIANLNRELEQVKDSEFTKEKQKFIRKLKT